MFPKSAILLVVLVAIAMFGMHENLISSDVRGLRVVVKNVTVGGNTISNERTIRMEKELNEIKQALQEAQSKLEQRTDDAEAVWNLQSKATSKLEQELGEAKESLKESQAALEDLFDPFLSPTDYEQLPPSRPSDQWLHKCATTLAQNESLVKPFYTVRPEYTLGDCIRHCAKCSFGLFEGEDPTATMAGLYRNITKCGRGRDKLGSVEQVFRIVEQDTARFQKPDPDDVVVHLRLGDVIERSQSSTEEMLTKGGIGMHWDFSKRNLISIWSVSDFLDFLQEDEVQHKESVGKIVIIGGSHRPNLFQKSRVYASCLQLGLAKAGRRVEMRLDGGDADQDFYFMSHAQRFVVSTGGFSNVIGQLVERHGGRTVGPNYGAELAIPLTKWLEGERVETTKAPATNE